MTFNRVWLTGNLTRDPELRQTNTGVPVLDFCLAVNSRRQNAQTGKWENVPNFFNCTLFGPRAPHVAALLYKGCKIAIEGKLRQSHWTAKDGSSRSSVEIIIESIDYLYRLKV